MKYIPIFTKEADELKKKNQKLIDDFNMLPFWKKWGKHEELRQQIIASWQLLGAFPHQEEEELR